MPNTLKDHILLLTESEKKAVLNSPIGSFKDKEQVGGKEKAKKISPLLSKPIKKDQHAFAGRLVGGESVAYDLENAISEAFDQFLEASAHEAGNSMFHHNYEYGEACDHCNGTGECSECEGRGNCDVCHGENICPTCNGTGQNFRP